MEWIFFNISNLTLQRLVFANCGGEVKFPENIMKHTNRSDVYIGPHQRAFILFSHCRNAQVECVSISGPNQGICMLFKNALGENSCLMTLILLIK